MSDQRPVVLCVDHGTAEQPWLRAVLAEMGARVRAVGHGEAALDAVAQELPDLMLVGTAAGGLDALEVVRRVTGEPQTAHLPVFVTAAAEAPAVRQAALQAGAADLLAPPMPRREMVARLLAGLRLKQAVDRCRRSRDEEQRVTHARDGLVRLVLDDLEAILGAARQAALAAFDEEDPAAAQRYARVSARELQAALATVQTLRRVRAIEAGQVRFEPTICELSDLVAEVVDELTASGLRVMAQVDPALRIEADPRLLRQALLALARQLADRLAGSPLRLLLASEPDGYVRLQCDGAVGQAAPLVDPLQSALELTLARMVAEAHGGRLELGEAAAGPLAMLLPPAPPAGTPWPPSSVLSRAGRGAADRDSAATVEVADILAARLELPAPRPTPRLMPPEAD